jgi:hypothetical protein
MGERKPRNCHPPGALAEYDDQHAQDREALPDRIAPIVRTGPSTGGRDPDRTGQHAPGAQAFRSLGLPGSAKQHVVVKKRQRGYDEATFVESFVIPNAAGGECLDNFEHLRAGAGLSDLARSTFSSPLPYRRRGRVKMRSRPKLAACTLRQKSDGLIPALSVVQL